MICNVNDRYNELMLLIEQAREREREVGDGEMGGVAGQVAGPDGGDGDLAQLASRRWSPYPDPPWEASALALVSLFDTFEEQLSKLATLINDSGLLGNTGKLKSQLALVKGGARTVQDNLAGVLATLKQAGRTDAQTAHHRKHLVHIADFCRSRHTRLVNRLSDLLSAHQANLTAQSSARRGLAADRSNKAASVTSSSSSRSIDELQAGSATGGGATIGGGFTGGAVPAGGGLRRRRGAGPDPAVYGSSHGAAAPGFVVPSAQSSSLLSRRGDSSTMAEVEATIVELGDVFRRVQSHVHEQDALVTRIDQDTTDAAARIDAAQAALSAFWHDLKNSRSLIFKLFAILFVMIVLVFVFFR
mmetsp:Transcript_13014/g.41064  ORF Transcript_13014/g.41064 Transcript_13014/m.41064 type:complete len:359 (-) Transcript_13014:54-1130(-)